MVKLEIVFLLSLICCDHYGVQKNLLDQVGDGARTFFCLVGELIQFILKDFLPFALDVSISLKPIIMGLSLGVSVSVLFALLPLVRTWYVSPLDVLRLGASPKQKITTTKIWIAALILVVLYGFSYVLLRNALYALSFILGIGFEILI